ncbi:hypothetical protein EIP91_002615 [Steccherinum ochraceum]|uniref:Cytochrome P450 n=1 Tax=Steccherinum ochraceum TaxID=92696 RepID=A0A4R0RV89_9APHY|nr:hypothetical protein EIP91_002615 [Steccherinum ochraceum]
MTVLSTWRSALGGASDDPYSYAALGYLSLLLGVATVGYFALWRGTSQFSNVPLPPGPAPGWKHTSPMFRSFDYLIQTYGPVVTLKRGNNVQIVIGSYQAALDIMQKHGSDLADRPPAVSANDILSGGKRTLLLRAGKRMTSYRKALHSSLQPLSAAQYEPLQFKNAKNYVLDILRDPDNHLAHARKYAAGLILTLTYGKMTATSYDDSDVVNINRGIGRLMSVMKGFPWPVDRYPLLRFLPLPHVRMLRKYHEDEVGLFMGQVETVRKGLINHTVAPNFTEYLLEHQKELELDDEELAYLAGSMYGAGSDTTGSGLGIVTMAAACHPDEQAKVQAEIDAVVGHDRVPNFEDLKSLPLTAAFATEAHRWRPILPMGINHRSMKDIAWNGYVIPAGATVSGIAWSIMRDPDVFPDPEEFRPSRWLASNGALRDDLRHFDFGFGRRVCPGIHVAERSLTMTTAQLLWACSISQDAKNPIDTSGFTDVPITHPLPFKVQFTPRIDNVHHIIESD